MYMTRRRVAILGLAVLTGCAIGQALDPFPAHADESAYLSDLAALGIPANSHALPLGYSICTVISSNGVHGVDQAVTAGISAGATHAEVMAVTVIAVQDLCPSNLLALNAWRNQTA